MEQKVDILDLSEAGLFQKASKDSENNTKSTRKTILKMRSFDLNKEPRNEQPIRKTKSLSSQFLVNIDELINETGSFLNNSDDEMGLLSIYESSSLHSINIPDPSAAATDDEDPDSCSWRKIQIEPAFGIYLKFEDVNYKVNSKNSNVEKRILQGVSGSVYPGEVLAFMGPSGGGKTTLLNLLSGRVKNNGGTITYNDRLYTKSLKRRIGFVLQDDIVFPHLTVKETLTYSALLRLPNALSREQKEERAMNVISELGLESCQNTMIGGTFVRGVSGGERKRAGKTVVTTIHQPSSRLFRKFDKLILLSKGCSLYFGKASEAMLYFSSIGCSPLIAMNPAEFLIDLANGNVKDKSIPSQLEDKFIHFETKDGGPSPGDVHEYLLGAYESRASKLEKLQINTRILLNRTFDMQNTHNSEECGANWHSQFSILFKRGLKERRHEYLSSLRIIQVTATSIIVGLLWWHSDASSTKSHVQDQASEISRNTLKTLY
ncbi:hypothetical protein BUALT_Bualt08G0106300 [Buddleja alternifolia]|uniref:ABC transporter domain-containing protein n=1 Tax=Buddleja alternifolia TaxID=168488 RepID=A0AAV6XBV0_9LAMI|nr:hypothetical protein BUALT_Bualt08G0106300 [Buddleja alternifolia]